MGRIREGEEETEDGWLPVLSSQRVDNPQVLTLAVMTGGKRSEVEDEDEEETQDTRSNTTYLKTSASTWHRAFYCSRVAARWGLVERGRMDRLENIFTAWALALLQKD